MTDNQQRDDPGFLTVSNLLSLSRIPLGVLFIAISDTTWLAVVVFVAALTDGLDGMIARVSGTQSHIGLLLDPLCDKLFVLLALSSFLTGPYLGWAGLLILILRDVFTLCSFLLGLIVHKLIPFTSRWGGKITTALQLLTLLALLFWRDYVPLLITLVGVTSVYAITDYGRSAIKEEQRQALAG